MCVNQLAFNTEAALLTLKCHLLNFFMVSKVKIASPHSKI